VETSKSALHFATTAKKVQMRPVVNEVKNDKTAIARMQAEIAELREQLVGGRGGSAAAACGGAGLQLVCCHLALPSVLWARRRS
jgi:hypothetical protein